MNMFAQKINSNLNFKQSDTMQSEVSEGIQGGVRWNILKQALNKKV